MSEKVELKGIIMSDAPQTVSTADSKKNFKRNTVVNIIFFIFNALTSFFMVPYQIKYLGIENYGMVSLANSFVAYTQILTVTLVLTVIRFVTFHLAREELDEARGYLNTQFIMSTVFFSVFLPICIVISYFTPSFLEIPTGQENNTRLLFALVYIAFSITIYCSSFQVAQFAKQRFDIKYGIEIGAQAIRYGTWIFIFNFLAVAPALWHIGLGYLFGGVFILVMTIISSRKLLPNIQPKLKGFCKKKCIDMLSMGSWFTVDQIGVILYFSIDILIINKTLGPSACGKYATIFGLAMMLRGIATTMSGMVTPVIVASYARNDFDSLVKNTCRATKFVSMGMAIVIGIFCGLAKPVLGWWLGEEFVHLWPLVWWLMAHHVLNCGVLPQFSVNLATNKVKTPAIVTCIGGVIKVALAIILVKYTNFGFYGVAIAGVIAFLIKNATFTPFYCGRIINRSSLPFYLALLPSVFLFTIVSGLGVVISTALNVASFVPLALSGSFILVLSGIIAWFIIFTKDDRGFFREVLKKKK